eukprot:gene18192-20007_t
MSAAQLFIGSLSRETQERDLENVFYKHGKLLRCDLKRGFGFVEYESPRDAEVGLPQNATLIATLIAMPITAPSPAPQPLKPASDWHLEVPMHEYWNGMVFAEAFRVLEKSYQEAIREENGRRLLGSRIVVEWAKGSIGDKTGRLRDRSRSRDRDYGGRSRRSFGRSNGYDRDRERSPKYSSYSSDSYKDRRRSISPRGRSYRDDRYDDRRGRDRTGGRSDRERFDRDSRYERDRFSRR